MNYKKPTTKVNIKAFSLVELIAVIFIIGILGLVVIPAIEGILVSTRKNLYESQIKNIKEGTKNWISDNIYLLPTENNQGITITLGQLKIDGFVEDNIKNPITKELFPDNMEIVIKKILNNYEYVVMKETGSGDVVFDENSPTIILKGLAHETVEVHSNYLEKGVIAIDPDGNEITDVDIVIKYNNQVVESIDTTKLWQYKVIYSVNYNGKTTSNIRTVTVSDTKSPILEIPSNIELLVGDVGYFDVMSGVKATDNSLKKPMITVSGTISTFEGSYYLEYKATDESGNSTTKIRKVIVKKYVPKYADASGAFLPVLSSGMIPITWSGKWVKADLDAKWYDYVTKEWANAVLINETKREYYKNASPGEEIIETDVLAYLVWIPRYKYKLFNVDSEPIPKQLIDVKFETSINNKETGSINGAWLTHPAFTFGSDELKGIWVGKFETTGSSAIPTIKPGIAALTNQNISTQFATSQKLNDQTKYGLTSNFDSYMMKNMEWGAVTYLSNSIYGKTTEVWTNPSSTFITGCAGTSTTPSSSAGCSYLYTTDNGQQASTTGNMYGIYDMSGGAYEYMMSGMYNSSGTGMMVSYSGFSQAVIDGPAMEKYIDKYAYGETINDDPAYSRRKLGDATSEVRGWNGDNAEFIYMNDQWFHRGGRHNNGTITGIFSFFKGNSYSYEDLGFRVVVSGISD